MKPSNLPLDPKNAQILESPPRLPEHTGAKILFRCAKCHSSPDKETPGISFDNEAALSSYLRTETNRQMLEKRISKEFEGKKGQMPPPPKSALTDEERNAVMKYLQELRK